MGDGKKRSPDIVISDGRSTGKAQKTPLVKKREYEVYKGKGFLFIKNLSKNPLVVNEKLIQKKGFTSLWSPIKINGKKVWF